MKPVIDVSSARIDYPGKGQDRVYVRDLGGDRWLLALADGLTMNHGTAAAEWAIDHMRHTTATSSVRALLAGLRNALAHAETEIQSETTLTAGILSLIADESEDRLRFDYFAVGDSPIWCVFNSGGDPPYQRHEVHGAVYPGEHGRVYSTIRLSSKDIIGKIAFGAVEVAFDEVLVVCSDGVPQSTIFEWDFQERKRSRRERRLCDWLYQEARYSDEELEKLLATYLRRRELSDDASLIAARIVRQSGNDGEDESTLRTLTQRERHVALMRIAEQPAVNPHFSKMAEG